MDLGDRSLGQTIWEIQKFAGFFKTIRTSAGEANFIWIAWHKRDLHFCIFIYTFWIISTYIIKDKLYIGSEVFAN